MSAPWVVETRRWAGVGLAAAAALFCSLYTALFVILLSPFPKDLAEPTVAFLMGSLVVLGSLPAPRYRLATATALFALAASLCVLLLGLHPLGLLAGGLVTLGSIAWWFSPRRTRSSTRRVAVTASGTLLGFIVLVCARYVDRPALVDPMPPELTESLGRSASRVTAFYLYDLGGFIDHQWLWRIDAEPDVVALMVRGLNLQTAGAAPAPFWRMPPYYWPRSTPADAEIFQSSMFSSEQRGPDGPHYFLLHDRSRGRAFVWYKSNF